MSATKNLPALGVKRTVQYRRAVDRILASPSGNLTTGDVAVICGVAARTVSKWFDSGRLNGFRIPGSMDRRVPVRVLKAFMRDNGIPLPPALEERRAVACLVSPPVAGVPTYTVFDVAVLVSERAIERLVIGCADGVNAAMNLARRVREMDASVRLVLILSDDYAAGQIPPAVFDEITSASGVPLAAAS